MDSTPTRPWYRKKRWWAAGVVAVIIIAAAAGGSSDKKKPATQTGTIVSTSSTSAAPTTVTTQRATTTTQAPTTTTVALSSCDQVREALLTGTQSQINTAMAALQSDKAADQTAREYADYYLHRDAGDAGMREADIGLIRMGCG